jgi:hypothetical protein
VSALTHRHYKLVSHFSHVLLIKVSDLSIAFVVLPVDERADQNNVVSNLRIVLYTMCTLQNETQKKTAFFNIGYSYGLN